MPRSSRGDRARAVWPRIPGPLGRATRERTRRTSVTLARALAADDGSASVEYVAAGVLLLVPFVYLVLVVAAVHGAALGTEGAARQGARVLARAADESAATRALEDAVAVTLADYGVDRGDTEVVVACRPAPDDCLRRGGTVTVTVTARVPLPLVPSVLDVRAPAVVPVTASVTQPVSRFRVEG